MSEEAPRQSRGISRRALLAGGAVAGLAIGARDVATDTRRTSDAGAPVAAPSADRVVPFWGARQAGIATAPQRHLQFASFRLTTSRRDDVADLLRAWTLAASRVCAGEMAAAIGDPVFPPADSGEAMGIGPSRLTITFGFGPGLFLSDGANRYGLADRRPAALIDLPPFSTDRLEPDRSGGDLAVQACADDPQVAFHAVRTLARMTRGVAMMQWSQTGFRAPAPADGSAARNLMGFKDGTNNIPVDNDELMDRLVWVGVQGPAWMEGGSYLVIRRIRMRIEQWDRDSLSDQSARIGRDKLSGAPLGGLREADPADLGATAGGQAVIASDAHIRLASDSTNGGARILRRSYSFADGVDENGGLDAGLFFACFQRDPASQFVAIQRRLADHDALNRYIVHTGSALFACPPGVRPGGWIGQGLFDRM